MNFVSDQLVQSLLTNSAGECDICNNGSTRQSSLAPVHCPPFEVANKIYLASWRGMKS